MSATTKETDADLIRFDFDILIAIARVGGKPIGKDILEHLEEEMGMKINTGRLYPRFDDLAEDGYITKTPQNNRSNFYELTEKGEQAVDERARKFMSAKRYIDK